MMKGVGAEFLKMEAEVLEERFFGSSSVFLGGEQDGDGVGKKTERTCLFRG